MKNKKLITVVSASVLAVGLIGGVYVAQATSADKTEKKQNQSGKELEKSIDDYLTAIYTDKTYTDVKDNVKQSTIDEVKQFTANQLDRNMNKATKKKFDELVTAPQMVYIKNTISGMYESEGVAKSTLNEKDFEKLSNLIKQLQDKKEVFATNETKRLTVAQESYKQAKDASDQVNSLFDNEVVKDDVTRETYQGTLDKVSALKQVTLKDELIAKLSLVDAKLTEKEQTVIAEEQAVQAEQEIQAKAEQEKVAAVSANSNAQNGDSTSNTGYTDNNYSTVQNNNDYQGSNSTTGATQQPATPTQPSSPSPGTSWEGTTNGTGGVISGQNNDNGTGTHNNWEGFDW